MNDPLERYAFDLRKSTAPPNHIGVGSLFGVTSPLHGTVMGVIGCFSPPYAAGELLLSVRLEADDRLIDDAGSLGKDDCGLLPAAIVWRPDRIVRRGPTIGGERARRCHSPSSASWSRCPEPPASSSSSGRETAAEEPSRCESSRDWIPVG
ncbi:hypothetical protein [Cohnella algarum]|uniref:hypothetical protein n=1 Tax=Cohnella algarum TaxID=2044859 RepID=UPI00196724D1|nr:hypothetical protein [Cohnella algarum]MBN2984712.1 hypothetical protein [Cohnella algarum]